MSKLMQKNKEPLVIYNQDIPFGLTIVSCNIRGDIKILDCVVDKDIRITKNMVGGKIDTSHTVTNAWKKERNNA